MAAPIGLWNRAAAALERWILHDLLALCARLAIAGIFFNSARTTVEGLLTLKDSTFTLCAEEYRVPLLPPELAAYLATYAEHFDRRSRPIRYAGTAPTVAGQASEWRWPMPRVRPQRVG